MINSEIEKIIKDCTGYTAYNGMRHNYLDEKAFIKLLSALVEREKVKARIDENDKKIYCVYPNYEEDSAKKALWKTSMNAQERKIELTAQLEQLEKEWK